MMVEAGERYIFTKFLDDQMYWPDGSWWDDVALVVDGCKSGGDFDPADLADNALIEVAYGYVTLPSSDRAIPLPEYAQRWMKSQTTTVLLVEVPASKREEVAAAVAPLGGRVVA